MRSWMLGTIGEWHCKESQKSFGLHDPSSRRGSRTRNNLSRQEVIDAENELAKAVQAKNSWYWVQKAGLNAEACIASPTIRMVEPMFNQTMNGGDPQSDVEQETGHYHRWSVALTMSTCHWSNMTVFLIWYMQCWPRVLWISLIFHYICTLSDPSSGVPLLRPAS